MDEGTPRVCPAVEELRRSGWRGAGLRGVGLHHPRRSLARSLTRGAAPDTDTYTGVAAAGVQAAGSSRKASRVVLHAAGGGDGESELSFVSLFVVMCVYACMPMVGSATRPSARPPIDSPLGSHTNTNHACMKQQRSRSR